MSRPRAKSTADILAMIREVVGGASVPDVAHRYGVTPRTLQTYLRERGYTCRVVWSKTPSTQPDQESESCA